MNNNSENNSFRFRLISIDTIQVAVAEEQITTLVDWTDPTPLPFGPNAVLGVVCVQGRMFTVVNVTKLLRPETDAGTSARSILALRGDEQLALAVDTAAQTIDLSLDSIKPADSTETNLIRATFEHNGVEWQVLNVDELFNALVQGRDRRRRRT